MQSQNKKGRKFFLAAPKMASLLTACRLEKDTIFGAAEENFWSFLS